MSLFASVARLPSAPHSSMMCTVHASPGIIVAARGKRQIISAARSLSEVPFSPRTWAAPLQSARAHDRFSTRYLGCTEGKLARRHVTDCQTSLYMKSPRKAPAVAKARFSASAERPYGSRPKRLPSQEKCAGPLVSRRPVGSLPQCDPPFTP